MSNTTEHPKVFISYSWSTPEHEQFVIEFATSLRNHGVDAVLDKWDLKPGHDKYVFMESMVVDPTVHKVLVVCDRKYQEKANSRAGGVGTESQIISQELYGRVKQTKFVPVVCEYDDEGQPCLPVFMKGLIYIDVSSEERYGEGMDALLRLIYEQPFHQKPALGGAPAFVSSPGASYVKELGAALRAIQDGKANRQGLELLFVKGMLSEVTKLYCTPTGNDYDETVFQAITLTKGLRDQVAEYVDVVAAFSSDDPNSLTPFIKLMEGLGANFGPPEASGSFYPGWADLYRFFAFEVFLLQTAALIRHNRWACLRRLLNATFVIQSSSQRELKAETFIAFDGHVVSLDEHRNQRLKLNRVSLVADILRERCSADKTPFSELREADVFLMLASVVRAYGPTAGSRRTIWRARTAVYASYAAKLPVFLRAADEDMRKSMQAALGVASGEDLKSRLAAAQNRSDDFGRGRGGFDDFNFLESINSAELTK